MPSESIRNYLTSEERSLPLVATIDPGFVHKRKIQTILGPEGMKIVDDMIRELPDLPDWQREVRIDHIYKDVILKFCEVHKIKTLGEILHQGKGHMFCSTERLAPSENIYDVERAVSKWIPPGDGDGDYSVRFEYSTKRIAADTLKSRLHTGAAISILAELREKDEGTLIFEPILMGFPWLRSPNPEWADKIMWWNIDFFENFVEDIDEFSEVLKHQKPVDIAPMRDVPEKGFKYALAKLLGEPTHDDWGGEQSDFFTSHFHLRGKRISAAFLLKGPAKFTPMTLNHLGKNNDQIVRLVQEPADLLVVQHCHEILPPVRSTLRAFCVRPHSARHYCFIDGRDSLWLLNSYGLYDEASAKN